MVSGGRSLSLQLYHFLHRSAQQHGASTMHSLEAGSGTHLLQQLQGGLRSGMAATCRSQLHTAAPNHMPTCVSLQLLRALRQAGSSTATCPRGSVTGLMFKQRAAATSWRGWAGSITARFKSTVAAAPEAHVANRTASSAASAVFGAGGEALAAGVPEHARKQMMWWLGGTAAWVYTMVVIGGVTRLTRSGLSMTEWKFSGERPPLTQADWEAQFAKYKASPEFKLIHSSMTLEEFKFIFWMEYGHRMWGRFLGLAFAGPCAYFAARGWINGALGRRLGVLFFMGGTQGLVGWWMVRSGLQEPKDEWMQPRVSPYRLAGHLLSAFAIFATLTWTALDLGTPTPLIRSSGSSAIASVARGRLLPFAALVAITATSGAFVAGMDAGRAYNEWPLMDGQWVPKEYWDLWDRVGARNFFENTAAVQFDHRVLATSTATLALGLWGWLRYGVPAGALPRRAVLAMDFVAAITLAQFGLGVWTLLEYVPVHLGSAHQANALNLFTAVLAVLHALRPAAPSGLGAAVGRAAAPATVALVGAIAYGVTAQH